MSEYPIEKLSLHIGNEVLLTPFEHGFMLGLEDVQRFVPDRVSN